MPYYTIIPNHSATREVHV